MLNYFFVFGISYYLAFLTFFIFLDDYSLKRINYSSVDFLESSSSSSVSFKSFFGSSNIVDKPQEDELSPDPAEVQVQEKEVVQNQENISYKLLGIVSSSKKDGGFSVISFKDITGTYGVGDMIEESEFYVSSIYKDRVIITNGSSKKTIHLIEDDDSVETNNNETGDSYNDLSSLKEELMTNPALIMDYVSIQPGSFKNDSGYVITFKPNDPEKIKLLVSLGFEDKDLILFVDGLPVSDPANASKLFSKFSSTSDPFTLTVVRSGSLKEISVSF